MKTIAKLMIFTLMLLLATSVFAQEQGAQSANEELKEAAVEALISAPPERALPLARKVLEGDNSDRIKEKALFILSQIEDPAALQTLLEFASDAGGPIQAEAIRMIGISGNDEGLAGLLPIYEQGDSEVREAVLEALMIADDKQSVFDIAMSAEGEDYENAVDMLGVMNARDELRELRAQKGVSEALIDAYIVSDDSGSLRQLALDDSDPEIQAQAIEAMGVVGGDDAGPTLVQIYREAGTDEIREAALDGMLIADYDDGVLELYRSTEDPAEKKLLLERLVIMDSEEVWNLIDAALEGGL